MSCRCVHKAAKDMVVFLSFFLWLLPWAAAALECESCVGLWSQLCFLDSFFFFFFCLPVFASSTQLPNPENRTPFWICGAPFSPASNFLMEKLVHSFPNHILLVSFLSAEIYCLLDEVQSSSALIICQPLLPQLSPLAVQVRIFQALLLRRPLPHKSCPYTQACCTQLDHMTEPSSSQLCVNLMSLFHPACPSVSPKKSGLGLHPVQSLPKEDRKFYLSQSWQSFLCLPSTTMTMEIRLNAILFCHLLTLTHDPSSLCIWKVGIHRIPHVLYKLKDHWS